MAAQLARRLGLIVNKGLWAQEEGRSEHIGEIHEWTSRARHAAQDEVWRWLSKLRYHYEGLQIGRDLGGDFLMAKLEGAKAKRQWQIMQADGVFTPWRAHQRDQAPPQCPIRGATTSDFKHLLWEVK